VDVKSVATKPDMLRLWCHELSRVFHDRLINAEDRKWFFDLLDTKLDAEFDTSWPDLAPTGFLLYGDYVDPTADPRTYVHFFSGRDHRLAFATLVCCEYCGRALVP
jgi:dynein heavy chain